MSSPSTPALCHIEINGTRLAYRESGQGEPLVLVHGHLSDHRTWTILEHQLSTRFHIYNYSKRYSWPNESIPDGQNPSWEQDSLDLESFIETLDISPVHVLGNSSGATVILWLARTKPHLFQTLLLEEPPLITLFVPTMPPDPWTLLSLLLRHPISFCYVMPYGANTVGPASAQAKKGEYELALTTFASGCLGPKLWPRILANPERMHQVDNNAKVICQFLRYGKMPIYLVRDARSIRVPVLVITGTDGPYFAQCINHELLRVCGASRKKEVKIQEAGHLIHEDNPNQVLEEIIRFVFGKQTTI
ncbi:Alpha/Beta hydrolase protein [Exophiala viscosa]|uniref:Alpha/Beta hydrolase protein n=1 Tax=Exophiala viscosa TaxID=2486360 RepID=A0AAN6IF34_9EURO|nr:Alpha/Beta hydrolase protein [Exophiala viscosa]KAI1621852.1 Alpha/Beta hydrolase protein [Exophiala viscosa]